MVTSSAAAYRATCASNGFDTSCQRTKISDTFISSYNKGVVYKILESCVLLLKKCFSVQKHFSQKKTFWVICVAFQAISRHGIKFAKMTPDTIGNIMENQS